MPSETKEHWENVFSTKEEKELSWFQAYPKRSVEFVDFFQLPLDAHIIDIGGGDSHFIDVLIERGYQHLYVLDISENALLRAKKRLGSLADKVHWIIADITEFEPPVLFDFWHDRAAFHFLTTENRIDKYVDIAEKSIRPGGYLILGTFSDNGPTKCSGLEIKQYSEASMSYRFENMFKRIKCIRDEHITPFNTAQHFLFCSFQKN
jgi:SAM-dependent methyltransferase